MIRARLLLLVDRTLACLMVAVLLGSILAFGGMVWWAPLVFGSLTCALVLVWLTRVALEGTWRLFKSPLGLLGWLTLGLAVVQLAPLPASLARRISPVSQELYSIGLFPELARLDDPDRPAPAPVDVVRSPVTMDRSATLRWLLRAVACLAIFGVAAQYADRVSHLVIIWGSVVAGFLLTTVFGLVQLIGGASGLYGLFRPGTAPWWAPSTTDLLASPVATSLRPVGEGPQAWAVPVPEAVSAIGGLIAGPGAYLALASLGLPLCMGLVLQLVAPRGSREPLATRLRESGRTSLVFLLVTLVVLGSGLVGYLAGPVLAVPFALGLVLVGLPTMFGSGITRVALGLTTLVLLTLASGVVVGDALGRPEGSSPLVATSGWPTVKRAWGDAAQITRDFPLVGAGLGGLPSVASSYKSEDRTTTASQSSLSRWAAESGLAGLSILVMGTLWCLSRLPAALRRVGSADRALASGLLGAVACFAALSVLHWTVELAAVALAASAVLGTWNRWLSGGTDLFLEPA